MARSDTSTPVLRIADLNERRPTRFELEFDTAQIRQFVEELDLVSLKKIRFKGELTAKGRDQWELTADLGATVQQACVISFVPVTTRIDDKITRRYVPEALFEQVAEDEEIAESSGDDAMDILPVEIDLLGVFRETLLLALPDYPRADGVELGERVFTEDGVKPMRDADAKPFAGLAALKEKLEKGE